jgi:hypothetical protein
MRHPTPDTLRRNAQALRREELARMARGAGLKWSTFVKVFHAPFPRQVPSSPHP